MKYKIDTTFLKFCLVGTANTIIDFVILNILIIGGLGFVGPKLIASSVAMLFSFFANRSFTFESRSTRIKEEFAKFIAVNVLGILLLQNILVYLLAKLLVGAGSFASEYAASSWEIILSSELLAFNIANVIAIFLSLVWNYFFYKTVVFASTKKPVLSKRYPVEKYGHTFKKNEPELTIIIPALREERRLPKTLKAVSKYLKSHPLQKKIELVIVAANGGDDTYKIAKAHSKNFYSLTIVRPGDPVGKGRDVGAGFIESKGKYRLFMDADLATPIKYVDSVVNEINSTNVADVIIGVRTLSSIHTGIRKYISVLGNLFFRALLVTRVSDTQCGFKAVSARYVEDYKKLQHISGWGFDMEIIAIAQSCGYKIKTIPVPDWKDVEDGTFEGDAFAGTVATFKDLLSVRLNMWAGKYIREQKTR